MIESKCIFAYPYLYLQSHNQTFFNKKNFFVFVILIYIIFNNTSKYQEDTRSKYQMRLILRQKLILCMYHISCVMQM